MLEVEADQVLWSVPPDERTGRPLLIVLHGHGMNEEIGSDVRHRLPSELVLASIRGPLRVRSGYGWFPLDLTLTLDQIDAVADDVNRWVDTESDFTSVGILGFSQGSSVALHCMRLDPQRYAYGVVLSGFVVPSPLPGDAELRRQRPPVFSGRGEADVRVPPMLVSLTDAWLRTHVALTLRTYPGLGHNVNDQEISDLAAFLQEQIG